MFFLAWLGAAGLSGLHGYIGKKSGIARVLWGAGPLALAVRILSAAEAARPHFHLRPKIHAPTRMADVQGPCKRKKAI